MTCTCRAPEPGWPQHTTWCGLPEWDVCRACGGEAGSDPGCPSCVREANTKRNEDKE